MIAYKHFHPIVQLCILLLCSVGVLYGVLGEKEFGLQNEMCALFLLAVSAYAGGKIIHFISLPELLGMLFVGITFRSLLSYEKYVSVWWSSVIRDCALTLILLKAGLGLDPGKLSKLKIAVLKLSLIPCLSEAIGVAVFSKLFLGLPWTWSLMLGFIICAVSAAVLVPGMIDLDEKRFGTEKGISTLMLAAVSVDNTIALSGFFISINILTSQEITGMSLLKRALEPLVGVLLGGALGLLMGLLCKNSKISYDPALFLCLGGLNFIFLSKRLDVAGAGALGCVSLAFIASLSWRQNTTTFSTLVNTIGILWKILEIFLFALIGVQVTLGRLKQNLGVGVGILFLGILIRIVTTFVSLCGTNMNCKEKLFISATWISKATVQAAVGSMALEYLEGRTPEMKFGEEVLSLCVLSIVLTAPLGALMVDHLGPLLLKKEEDCPPLLNSEKVVEAAHEIAQIMHNEGMVS